MGVPEMTALAATAKVTPAVNQIELHPWLQWKHVTDYCKEHNIVLEVRTAACC
jgi:diketogulonate reductase-like aldo/keto reductase